MFQGKNLEKITDYTGSILYLHYPNYKNHSKNTFSGKFGEWWDNTNFASIKIPVGHSAIILIDKFGTTKYYEYGRYDNSIGTTFIVGKYRDNYGNFRRKIIPNKKIDESFKSYIARIKKELPFVGDMEVTLLSHIDVKAAEDYIKKLANDYNRKKYSETNTCATLANIVATKFQDPNYCKGNLFNGICELFNNNSDYNIFSDIMTIIPYTSHNYNAEIRSIGDETWYFNEE